MIINHTDTESWTVEDILSSLSDYPNKKRKIYIPKFQRTLVWKKEQQKDFIDSIRNGFPIGALLLYKLKEENGVTMYNLIDGLQRSTALNQYSKNPTKFFDESNISIELIGKIFNILEKVKNDIESDKIIESLVLWIRDLKGFTEKDGFSSYKLTLYLNKTFELNLDPDVIEKITDEFVDFLDNIRKESNIDQFKIPILIYNGEQSNLPSIFERLNSKGTQLSKYQIYAATWVTFDYFQITNRDIIEGIKNKYDLLLEEGYEVEDYDTSLKFYTSNFSTFEYLFGFGKYLATKYPLLFSSNSKSEQEDSFGFNVMSICLDLPFNKMSEIPMRLKEFNIDDFELKIINSIDFVFNSLKGHISLKLNSRSKKAKSNKISQVHSELQIVSMIGKAFHARYDNKLNEKTTWKDVSKKLNENLIYHYLFDILRYYWKGSGDSKAYELSKSDKYEKTIAKNSWENILTQWFDDELQKKEKVRVNIKEVSLLFYKYLYSFSLSAYEEVSNTNFDIEHLVPVSRLKDISGQGLPISAFPNLCILTESLNREKGDNTFYEHFDLLVKNSELTQSQADSLIIKAESYSHTKRNDLDFVSDEKKFTPENYIKFLNDRFQVIKEQFFVLNKIE